MAPSAQLLLDALSKPTEPDLLAGVSDPDCGLDGCGSFMFSEPPLTSEPPLAETTPLTSETPIAAGLPLTSEPAAAGYGTEPMEV
ncbi:hypothetical protein ABT381_31715 [Streptomyces sp. NPDC000151]|uniref:hypothetical protein n=1 Tax=Streptomyces sp. NPDC000151 TaxID=3154244 RepID=UPI003327DDE9